MSLKDRLKRTREKILQEKINTDADLNIKSKISFPVLAKESMKDWNINGFVASKMDLYKVSFPTLIDIRPFKSRHEKYNPDSIDSGNLLFFDLETSGLSGGAGTVAFMAAFGRINNGNLSVNQYFMLDYPGESDFLNLCIHEMDNKTVLVSYNGKCFDEPLLKSRLILNRMKPFFLPHIDILYSARRLWKRKLQDCSLKSIERAIGIDRGYDILGEDIPEIWFSFLRKGWDPRIEHIARHNSKDIFALANIMFSCLDSFQRPLERIDVDLTGIGKKIMEYDLEAALPLLLAAHENGDNAGSWYLFKVLKKIGKKKQAFEILERIQPSFETLTLLSSSAEFKEKNIEKALNLAQKAKSYANTDRKKSFAETRVTRLENKKSLIRHIF